MALGAQRWRVMLQVVREGLRLAALGAIAGGLASLPVARWLERITPSAESVTVWVWLAVPVVLILAVTIASVFRVRALAITPCLDDGLPIQATQRTARARLIQFFGLRGKRRWRVKAL